MNNRIIKFRAFHQKSQTFVYFNLSEGFTDEGYNIYRDLIIEGAQFQQFTGLIDKSKTDIFDGDSLKDSRGNQWDVSWNQNHACFQVFNAKDNVISEVIDNKNMTLI